MLTRVLAAATAQFSLFQPVPKKVDLGFHFGDIVGDKSSTILTLGGPWPIFGGPVDVAFSVRWLLMVKKQKWFGLITFFFQPI